MALEKLGQTSAGTQIDDADINKLFLRLEEIRQKHAKKLHPSAFIDETTFPPTGSIPEAFATNVVSAGTQATTSVPAQIKSNIQKLEGSRYINSTYSNQINVPSVGAYIQAATYYNNEVNIINQLIDICTNDSNNSNNSVHTDNADWNWCSHNGYVMGHSGFCNTSGGI